MADQDFSLLLSAFPKAPAADPQSSGGSAFDRAVGFTLKEEGGYVANDAGAGETNFGINKRANPDVDIRNLTEGGAKDLYKTRYWNSINGDDLAKRNPALATVAFDTAVNMGPAVANDFIKKSGGDPAKMIQLRAERYRDLIASNPQKYGQYADSWNSRLERLSEMVPTSGTASSSFSDVRPLATDRTMGEAVADNLLGAGAGVVTGAKLIADAFGANNAVSNKLDDASKALMDNQSQYRKDQRTERAIAIKQAENSGSTWNEIVANVAGFAEAPLETTLNALGTSAPTLLMSVIPGLGQAQAARLILQGAMGATQGMGAAKGSIYEAVRDQLVASGMSRDDAEKAAAGAQAYDGENGGMIAANAILGAVAGTSGIEAAAGRLAGRKAGDVASRGLAGRAAMGVVKESPVEGAQGGTERATTNIALQNQGFDVPTMQGVAGQAAGEALASAPGGAVFGALDRPVPAPTIPPELQPVVDRAAEPNSPLSRAAVSGVAAQGVLQQAAVTDPDGMPPAAPAGGADSQAGNDQTQIGNTANPMGPGPSSDPYAQKAAELEQMIRSQDLVRSLREDGAGLDGVMFDLRTLRDPNAREDIKRAAQQRLEEEITWAQTNWTPKPKAPSLAETPGFEPITDTRGERPQGVLGSDIVQATLRDPQIGPKISDTDRQNVLQLTQVAQNTSLPMGTRQQAAQQAIEIVGLYRAAAEPVSREESAPAEAALVAPEGQQSVVEQTAPVAEQTTARTPAGTGPAVQRRRSETLAQLVSQGFETVERRGSEFFLKNSKTGAEFKLDGMADAAMARNLINKAVDAKAHTAAASPLNDRLEPTEAQIAAGNYKKSDVIDLNGMKIKIENPRGSVRRGVGADGKPWETTMAHHYGEFQGTEGADGDKLDVFLGPRNDTDKIYVIDQVNKDGSFDEHKVMMGFTSEQAAREGYLANYEKGWTGLGAITEMTPEQFKAWAKSREAKKPLSEAVGGKGAPAPSAKPQGQFATLDEAKRYLSAQRRNSGSLAGLPLQLADGSYTVVAKGGDQYAEAERQRDARDQAEQYFTVQDGGKQLRLRRVRKAELPQQSSQRRPGQPRDITQDEATVLERVAALLGKKIEFFVDPDKTMADGFVDPKQPGKIFVATKTTVNPLAVLGHEFYHELRRTNPEAWNAIADVVRGRITDPKGFRGDYYGKVAVLDADGNVVQAFRSKKAAEKFISESGRSDLKVGEQSNAELGGEQGGDLEELISDVGGNLMLDQSFWADVFKKIDEDHGSNAEGILQRLANTFNKFVAKVLNGIGQGGFRGEDFLSKAEDDVKAVRDAFTKALAAHLQSVGSEAAPAEGDVTKSTKREDQPAGLTVEGYHFSKAPRTVLNSRMFGQGLKGSARDEIMQAADKRLRDRIYFYVDKGTGINPEAGVGGYAHKATLRNVYDADADPLRLRTGDARAFESKVLDAGYSGYLTRLEGTQSGQVIMLGQQNIKVEPVSKIDGTKPVRPARMRDQDLADRIMAVQGLPAGAIKPQAWAQALMAQDPALAAQLLDIGAFEGTESLFKDELAAKVRSLGNDIRKSAARAQEEYAEVEAKYKGTDEWLKAPNGEKTNLSERQWVQVRTPSFKKWFGDWEKHARAENPVGSLWSDDNVSKAVDKNGEPLVVYHGSDKGGFVKFDEPGGSGRGDLGIWTTDNYGMARSYVRKGRARDVELAEAPSTREDLEAVGFTFFEQDDGSVEVDTPSGYTERYDSEEQAVKSLVADYADDIEENLAGTQPGIYALFIDIKNPGEANFEGALWNGDRVDQYQVRDENDEPVYSADGRQYFDMDTAQALVETTPGAEMQPADSHYETTDDVVKEARKYNDGAIIREVIDDGGGVGYNMEPSDIYVTFDPRQVKSADYNNGEFSDSTDDIRKSAPRKAAKKKAPAQDPAIGDKTDVSKLPDGKAIPADVAVGSLEGSLKRAASKSYRRGRELKKDIQDSVLEAARNAKVNLSLRTKATFRFLADMVIADAKFALKSNENAVGWYDQKVSRAIGALSTVHPEIETDPRSRLAFLWALATTSNGVEVGDNFRIAERAYREWKATGQMPTNVGIGTAATNINKGLRLYNDLVEKVGDERLLKFMSTKFTVGEIRSMLGIKPGGEWMGTPVRGAAILGPKIGNGFFSNLNGYFDALTMDRWLMRTWGRMTGTLLQIDEKAIRLAQKRLSATIDKMSPEQRREMSKIIGKPVRKGMTRAELAEVAKATDKSSMKPEKREVMQASPETDRFRLDSRTLYKTLDGQKEAPDGPAERNWIRAVFQDALEKLQAEGKDMTMSDLQALLWYPERRLYDAAKSDEDIEAGYEDDEAPDYANAALELALANGVDRNRVLTAMDAAEARGTVVGKPLSDAERKAMLEEFRKPPEQQFQIAFEAAPNPDDREATEAWNRLGDKDKATITQLVKDAVLADLAGALGMRLGKAVMAKGGYEGQVNPNVIAEYKLTQVSIEDARALASAIGIALKQKSVAVVDSRASKTNGLVRINLSEKADKHVAAVMAAIAEEAPGVTGFTARGNNIDILNFTDTPTEQLAGKIEQALDGIEADIEATVSFGDVNSELVEEGDYESQITGARPETGREILERARRARDRVGEIIGAELRARSVGEVSDGAGNARRAAAGDIRKSAARDGSRGQEARGNADRSLEGPEQEAAQQALKPLPGAPTIKGATGPDPRLVAVAEQYARDNGITLRRQAEYVKVDPQRAKRIAAAYEAMAHDPQNPRVKEAYQNLIRQTRAQYDALVDAGYKFWFMDMSQADNQEYASTPWNAMRDLRANQAMGVFPTMDGFGTSEEFTPDSNPLLEDTGLTWPIGGANGKRSAPVLANDLFRAVHDAFGHGLEGAGFRAEGEENAWQAHVRLFTGSAVGAITSETRGQNSWLNYGPYGDKNRTAKVEDTVFADQKTGLMPEWTWTEGRVGDTEAKPEPKAKPAKEPKPAAERTEVSPKEATGRKVMYEVQIEESGDTAKLTVDAGAALEDYNSRVAIMNKLLECLRK